MNKVNGLYASKIEKQKACGYCRHHRCCLTVKQLKAHSCLSKDCYYLVKYENHEWWKQRERAKAKKKANKQIDELLI